MREKIARFMQGRYGVDELARFLTGLSMVWIVLELITRNRFFEILFWVTVVWLYYRILSRDYGKRQQENSKFLTLRYRFTSKWNQWNMILLRKRHIISINVQDADRRSGFPEEKARLPSYVPSVIRNL